MVEETVGLNEQADNLLSQLTAECDSAFAQIDAKIGYAPGSGDVQEDHENAAAEPPNAELGIPNKI